MGNITTIFVIYLKDSKHKPGCVSDCSGNPAAALAVAGREELERKARAGAGMCDGGQRQFENIDVVSRDVTEQQSMFVSAERRINQR